MSKIRVAVLRGGPSSEYDVSLLTGNTILKNLPQHYYPIDVLISRDGVWHVDGLPREPHSVLTHADVVVNALHGEYGGYRSFHVGGDLSVIYEEINDDMVQFILIGTHPELYG